jgi:hypothetical protein
VQERRPLLRGARAAKNVHRQHDGHGVEPAGATGSEGAGPMAGGGACHRCLFRAERL